MNDDLGIIERVLVALAVLVIVGPIAVACALGLPFGG